MHMFIIRYVSMHIEVAEYNTVHAQGSPLNVEQFQSRVDVHASSESAVLLVLCDLQPPAHWAWVLPAVQPVDSRPELAHHCLNVHAKELPQSLSREDVVEELEADVLDVALLRDYRGDPLVYPLPVGNLAGEIDERHVEGVRRAEVRGVHEVVPCFRVLEEPGGVEGCVVPHNVHHSQQPPVLVHVLDNLPDLHVALIHFEILRLSLAVSVAHCLLRAGVAMSEIGGVNPELVGDGVGRARAAQLLDGCEVNHIVPTLHGCPQSILPL